jgi:hypothetical protein
MTHQIAIALAPEQLEVNPEDAVRMLATRLVTAFGTGGFNTMKTNAISHFWHKNLGLGWLGLLCICALFPPYLPLRTFRRSYGSTNG